MTRTDVLPSLINEGSIDLTGMSKWDANQSNIPEKDERIQSEHCFLLI